MTLKMALLAVAFAAQSAAALAHPGHLQPPAAGNVGQNPDAAAVRSVLAQYQAALQRLDARGTETLFAPDSAVFETGGSEGTYANYLAHHLGPELTEFASFTFSDYVVDVRLEGPLALTSETYKYRIVAKDGTIADRLGVTTSVLKKIGGSWKILVSHNSGRKPRGN